MVLLVCHGLPFPTGLGEDSRERNRALIQEGGRPTRRPHPPPPVSGGLGVVGGLPPGARVGRRRDGWAVHGAPRWAGTYRTGCSRWMRAVATGASPGQPGDTFPPQIPHLRTDRRTAWCGHWNAVTTRWATGVLAV